MASGSEYSVYYVKDDAQTQDTNYTVKHVTVLDGVETEQASDTYISTAWINEQNPMIAIEEGSLDQKTYTGYKFDSISVDENATEVASGTTITLKYVKDDAQTQDTNYTVKYFVDGVEQTDDAVEKTSTAWINDNPAMIAIQEEIGPANKYEGYKLADNQSFPAVD